jgi:kumamolisin
MTLQEYSDGVSSGSLPVLDHDAFVYQFGAVEDEIKLVEDWAKTNNLTIFESHTGMAVVKVQGTAEQYNSLFGITLNTVTEGSAVYYYPDGEIVVPNEINDVVQAVLGLDTRPVFKHNAILDTTTPPDLGPNAISAPTPVDLALAYKFARAPGGDLVQGKGVCIAIVEFGGGWTTQNLTSTFGRIGQPNPTVVDVLINGGSNNPADAASSGEVMLDIYCAAAVAPASRIAMYFSPNSLAGFIDVMNACAVDTVNSPVVMSISWGTYDTSFSSSGVLTSLDTAFQACNVRGITSVAASGDYGVRAISGGGTYTLNHPSTSPYVLAAGGTVVSINNDYTIASEQPWGTAGGSFAAGGGVSTIYSVPTWQTGLTSKLYPSGNVAVLSGRATPDVSAMATGYTFYYSSSNSLGTFLGTSATAPLLSGMVARLVSLTGKKLGFVNADWYSIGSTAFNDMTSGDNHGGNTVGYMAQAGWDAASGLGSPKGDVIYQFYKKGGSSIFPRNNGTKRQAGQAWPRPVTILRI